MKIQDGQDGGGWRQFLDGKPLHAGDMVEIEVAGRWLPARYEMDYHRRRGVIYIQPLWRGGGEIVFNVLDDMEFSWPIG